MHLFPGGGFQESAVTPVFLGVLVSWLFAETLGWVFAGLVVPGYLATLFVVEPKSALIDVVEAALTYFLARALGEHLSRAGVTSRSFGRERFLLIVLMSVLVRVVVEGVILPQAFAQPSWAYSIGLVVVPLAANACWKMGLPRGIIQNGVPALLVYALLRWVLIPHTNLSLAGFHLLTEDVAASFLGSPKAYFVLLTGAALASIANVKWGWDFGGILIPGLLGLVVLHPAKLLSTGAEALLLVGAVHVLRAGTPVGRWNIEGPRRLVLFFSVDYALRFAAAWVAGPRLGSTSLIEITGFGYLLPSLLAVKISQKRDSALVLLPTAIVAVAGFAFGSASGFAFDALGRNSTLEPQAAGSPQPSYPSAIEPAVRWSAATASRRGYGTDSHTGRDAQTLAHALSRAALHPDQEPPPELFLRRIDDVCWFGERLHDLDKRRGGAAVFTRCHEEHPTGLVLFLPAPLASPAAASIAGSLFSRRAVDAVVVAGVDRNPQASELDAVAARELAEHLAERGGARATVVDLVDTADGRATEATDVPASLLAALDAFGVRSTLAPGLTPMLRIDPSTMPLAEASPSAARIDATSLAAADELDGAELRATSETPEELLAVRRLVLEPLLGEPDATGRALAMSAARALGFRVDHVLRGSAKTPTTVLVPTTKSPRLGLVVRDDGGGAWVVELAHGEHTNRRRFGTALAATLDASVVIVTFEAGAAPPSSGLMGEAMALATWARPLNDRALVRIGPAGDSLAGRTAAVSSWDVGEGAPAPGNLDLALHTLGVTAKAQPMNATVLEAVTRHEPRTTPTFVVAPSPAVLGVFSPERADLTGEQWPSSPSVDADCGVVAGNLATTNLATASDLAVDLPALALASALNRSVTARRRLDELEQRGVVKLALVRASSGRYLAAAIRSASGLRLTCTAFDATDAHLPPARESSVEGCVAGLMFGGICDVERRAP